MAVARACVSRPIDRTQFATAIGISAIAHLAPLLDYVDMDGAALLSKDIARGATVVRGRCQFPTGNGSGAELFEDNLIP